MNSILNKSAFAVLVTSLVLSGCALKSSKVKHSVDDQAAQLKEVLQLDRQIEMYIYPDGQQSQGYYLEFALDAPEKEVVRYKD